MLKIPPVLAPALPLLDALIDISDPRGGRNQRHSLMSVLIVAICAVISGADNWISIEAWGNAKRDWLSGLPRPPQRDCVARHLRSGLRAVVA
jgi:hypothetical protein